MLVDRVPVAGFVSDVAWIDETTIGLVTIDGPNNAFFETTTLDRGALVAGAASQLVRDFSPDECEAYGIERCAEPGAVSPRGGS